MINYLRSDNLILPSCRITVFVVIDLHSTLKRNVCEVTDG